MYPLLSGKSGETHLLLANEAIVRGAIEAGVGFISCYPGTPSSEIPDTFFRLSKEAQYIFEYSVNEKIAMEAAGGASLAGVPSLVTMKHVGVNVAADPFMTLVYIGTPGGMVLVSADDPGCHSSQNEQDNRYFAQLGTVPVFEPLTAQEAKDMTAAAFSLSAKWEQPIMLRTTTRVNHLRGSVQFGEKKSACTKGSFQKNSGRFVAIPAVSRRRHDILLRKFEEITEYSENCPWNTVYGEGSVGFIASGISRAYLHDALQESGRQAKVLELGFSWPLPQKKIIKLLQEVKTLVVVEELEPIVETAVRALAQKHGCTVEILGKGEIFSRQGEYSVQLIRQMLAKVFDLEMPSSPSYKAGEVQSFPLRPPNLCAGCTHRSVYHNVRRIFGDDVVYSSDIGCYTLGILPPLKTADFSLCMGSSISAGGGMAAVNDKPVIAFIGDSTFFHSGITGLINALCHKRDMLIVILDNRTTAMTGHQPNPGVDDTLVGVNSAKVDITAVVRGCGVAEENVRLANALNYKAVEKALLEFREKSGVRVLITQSPCPLFARRAQGKKYLRTAYVVSGFERNASVLECAASLGCPAFSVAGGLAHIDEEVCIGCMLCVQLSSHIKAKVKK